MREYVRPNDLDHFDIYIIKDDLTTLKVSFNKFILFLFLFELN